MFPVEKYKYFTNNKDLVIAEQTFAGKKYRGKAVLHSPDKFDLKEGKAIAAAKCDLKICSARAKYALKRMQEAHAIYEYAKKEYERMADYYKDAQEEEFWSLKRFTEIMIGNGVK